MPGDTLTIHRSIELQKIVPSQMCSVVCNGRKSWGFFSRFAHRQQLQCTEDISSAEIFLNFNSTEKRVSIFLVETQVC